MLKALKENGKEGNSLKTLPGILVLFFNIPAGGRTVVVGGERKPPSPTATLRAGGTRADPG